MFSLIFLVLLGLAGVQEIYGYRDIYGNGDDDRSYGRYGNGNGFIQQYDDGLNGNQNYRPASGSRYANQGANGLANSPGSPPINENYNKPRPQQHQQANPSRNGGFNSGQQSLNTVGNYDNFGASRRPQTQQQTNPNHGNSYSPPGSSPGDSYRPNNDVGQQRRPPQQNTNPGNGGTYSGLNPSGNLNNNNWGSQRRPQLQTSPDNYGPPPSRQTINPGNLNSGPSRPPRQPKFNPGNDGFNSDELFNPSGNSYGVNSPQGQPPRRNQYNPGNDGSSYGQRPSRQPTNLSNPNGYLNSGPPQPPRQQKFNPGNDGFYSNQPSSSSGNSYGVNSPQGQPQRPLQYNPGNEFSSYGQRPSRQPSNLDNPINGNPMNDNLNSGPPRRPPPPNAPAGYGNQPLPNSGFQDRNAHPNNANGSNFGRQSPEGPNGNRPAVSNGNGPSDAGKLVPDNGVPQDQVVAEDK